MPALNHSLCGGLTATGVKEANAEFATDEAQRVCDVRWPAIHVVVPGWPVPQDCLLESVLLPPCRLAGSEVAVRWESRGAVDLSEQVALAELAIGQDRERAVQGIAYPEVSGVLANERSSLVHLGTGGTPGHRSCGEQAMDAQLAQLPRPGNARTDHHFDQPPDGGSGVLGLGPQQQIRDDRANGARLPLVGAVLGHQGREPVVLVGVVPGLDGAPAQSRLEPLGLSVPALGSLAGGGTPA